LIDRSPSGSKRCTSKTVRAGIIRLNHSGDAQQKA
jgi:hypothetical protein